MRIFDIIKNRMLPIAMVTGASGYLLYHVLPEPFHVAGPYLGAVVEFLQPLLIFSMLFLTFCRIEPKDLKPHRWHWWLLLVQGGLFTLLGLAAWALLDALPASSHDKIVLIESAMLCLICPTAGAAAVVTRKLGGDVAGITTYTILINLVTAVLVPLIVPLIRPMGGLDFWTAFCMITAKIFPLLILPCLFSWLVRYMAPKLHRWFLSFQDLPFYLWGVALTLAIAITTKAIVHSDLGLGLLLMMSLISLVCCILQFSLGRYIGSQYRPRRSVQPYCMNSDVRLSAADGTALASCSQAEQRGKEVRKVTAGQALGQKNTVFAIWMAYTFMTPETAIVGGLYSIWHNIYNARQLSQKNKSDKQHSGESRN